MNGIATWCSGGWAAGALDGTLVGGAFGAVGGAELSEVAPGDATAVAVGRTEGSAGGVGTTCCTGGSEGNGTGGGGTSDPTTITSATSITRDQILVKFISPPPLRRPSLSGSPGVMLLFVGADMERALGALRDFTRRDILLRFFADRKPRSVDDVSREQGIHRSVAFDHLERLVALGYLEVGHRRGLPGKPAKIYKLLRGPVQISHPMRRYDIVAESLALAFDELGDIGSHAVRRAGRSFGSAIALSDPKTATAALEPMLEMGAEYDLGRGDIIECTNCLFAEVCRRAPVICRFHAGLLEGLMQRVEPHWAVKVLGFRDPYGCAFMLQSEVVEEPLQEQAQ